MKTEVKMIKPPCFDELSVEKLYPHVIAQDGMADLFPDSCKYFSKLVISKIDMMLCI